MEQHPIPRQVTTFEFKLIGFMTLKQFLYLVVFFPLGFIVWKIFPIPIINFLLGLATILIGVAFAFLPVNERPLDVWVRNFYKRLTSPTQYTYLKHNTALYFLNDLFFVNDPHRILSHIESQEKLATYLSTTAVRPTVRQAAPGQRQQLQQIMRKPTAQLTQQRGTGQTTTGFKAPPARPVAPTVRVTKPVIQPHKLVFRPATPPPVQPAPAEPPVVPEIQQTKSEAEEEAKQVREMFAHSAPSESPIVSPVRQAPVVSQPRPVVEQPVTKPAEMKPPVRINPNTTMDAVSANQAPSQLRQPFLTGVIKNNRKIPLPGVLVYLKDASGQAVRLLKTNPHGVFATYNPLPAGDYSVEVKDPKGGYFFDTMKITVAQSNPLPYELFSKELL